MLYTPVLYSQPGGLKFDQISIEQGLSQSTVYAIIQDSYGFMWFGTQDGLNRYDGYSVKVFKNKPNDSTSLSDNTIWSLLNDKNGDLWIGTMRGGLNRYILSEEKFVCYMHDEEDPESISENDVTSLYQDSFGYIWIGTRSRGLNRLDPATGKFTRFQYDEKDVTSLGSNSVRTIIEDSSHSLWITTNRGLSKLDLKNLSGDISQAKFIRYYDSIYKTNNPAVNNVRSVYMDKEGTLWLGTWGSGMFTFDQNLKKLIPVKTRNESHSPAFISSIYEDSKGSLWVCSFDIGYHVYDKKKEMYYRYAANAGMSIYEDKSGIIWMGTFTGGVKVYDKRKNRFKHYYETPPDPDDNSSNLVQAILEDTEGDIWIGTYGGGVKKYNSRKEKVAGYNYNPADPNSIDNDKVFALFQSSDGLIWIGTEGGLNSYDKKRDKFTRHPGYSNDLVLAINEDKKGNLWIGSSNGIIVYYRSENRFSRYFTPNSTPVNRVMTIYRSKADEMWIGTLRNGVHRLKVSNDSISYRGYYPDKNVTIEDNSGKTINNSSVISVFHDNNGIIWMGTYGGGLNRYDPEKEEFTYYTEKDGLPNDVVYGILPDKSGNLWLSTNRGISRFNPGNKNFRNYDARDGLQGNEFNQGSYYANKRGELYFGGVNGFNVFNPEEISDNVFAPPVYLTAFRIFDEILPLSLAYTQSKAIELSYSQNFFSFEFVALNYTSPEKNQYMYMLEGFDKTWHNVSSQRRYASYTNLDPGEYILHIKGSNNDGIWNDAGARISIIINPPFWMTWWFRILALITTILIGAVVYKYRVNQLIKMEQMRVRIASDLHDEIGSSLGSIVLRSRVLQRETKWTEKSRKELDRIYTTAMQTASAMRDIVWFVNPDFDTLDDMILRMKDTTQTLISCIPYEFIAPAEVLSTRVPLEFRRNIFLSYKEILHNIARHSGAVKVIVEIKIDDGLFNLKVSDNGTGFLLDSVIQGNGLRNMRKRISDINGQIEISAKPGEGTTIFITSRTT